VIDVSEDLIAKLVVDVAESHAAKRDLTGVVDVSQIFEAVKGESLNSLFARSKIVIEKRPYPEGDADRSLVYLALGKVFGQLLRHASRKGVMLRVRGR